nr:DMT family transporter [Enterococcus sp. 665A]MBO1342822.1 DMT family transporter [Enterococcus sp. 665A]
MGLLLFPVFIGLVFGVKHTSASTAGFLASTTVILVPIFEGILLKKLPHYSIVISTIIATVGLYLITIQEDIKLDLGVPFCLGAATCYAIYIIFVGKITKFFPQNQIFSMSIIQLGVVSVLGWIASAIYEKPTIPTEKNQIIAVVLLGIICSAYGFVAQPIAQKELKPSEVGIIFSLEPIFSAGLSFIILGEILSSREILGACLILSGVISSQTLPHLQSSD